MNIFGRLVLLCIFTLSITAKRKHMDNIANIIEAVTPTIDKMVASYAEAAAKHGWPFNRQQREAYRLDAMVDLLNVVGRYLLATDIIEVRASEGHYHKVEAWFHVTRDGVKTSLHTYTTHVRGLSENKDGSLRQSHLRYVVDTDLRKHDHNPALEEIKRERARRKKYDRIMNDIEEAQISLAREVSRIEEQMAMSDEQILDSNEGSRFLMGLSWETAHERVKEEFGTKAAYDAHIKAKLAEDIANHRRIYSPARIAAIQKEYRSRILKMDRKTLGFADRY